MAEYIDKNKLKKKRKYLFQTKGGAFPKSEYFIKLDDIFDMPTADVIERSKIDKAIEEMEIEYNNLEYAENHKKGASYGIRKSIEILKRNIGESRWQSI